MIVPLQDILLTLPCLVGFLLLFYVAGTLLFKARNKNTPFSFTGIDFAVLFWRLFTGLCLVVSLYAIIITRFQTCLLPVPLLLYFFCHQKVPVVPVERLSPGKKNILLYCLLAGLLYWFFFMAQLFSINPGTINYIGGDSSFYGRLADFINAAGRETSTPDRTGMMAAQNEPYHYGDIWLIALIKKLTGLHATLITYVVVYPLLAVIAVTGVASYIQEFFRDTKIKKIYFFILLTGFINGLIFFLAYLYPGYASLSDSLVSKPKLFLVTCILAGILLLLRQARWNAAINVACIGALLFTTLTPALFISFALVILFAGLRKKIKFRDLVTGVLAAMVTALYLLFFYRTYYGAGSGTGDTTSIYNIKTGFNIFLGGLSQFAALLPFLILLYFLYRHLKRDPKNRGNIMPVGTADIQFLILLPFMGLISWILFYPYSYDSVQLFQNVFLPLHAIAIMMILTGTFRTGNTSLKMAAFLLLMISVTFNYKFHFDRKSIPASELAAVKKFFTKYPRGFFVNTRNWEGSNAFEKNTVTNQPLVFLNYIVHPYENISLDIPFPETKNAEKYIGLIKKITAESPFGLYIKTNPNLLLSDKMYGFILEKKIRFFSAGGGVTIPSRIQPLLKDSVNITSIGWKLYWLGW